MSVVLIVSLLCLYSGTSVSGQNEYGEVVFQEALRWNYTYMNPTCSGPNGGRNPCEDIRICTFAAASLAIGGWPTLCGWVGKGVPKVCCGLPLVLGPGLMRKVNEEISRKRECGTRLYPSETEITKKLFKIKESLPEVDISDPNKFDPPLDLDVEPMLIPPSVYTGSRQGLFPWMVSIRKNGSHLCGGSLIDRKHILTTASCVLDDKNEYTVHIGNLHVDDGYVTYISKIDIHPGFEKFKIFKNLAVITLSEEIISPNVAHICLLSPDTDGVNMEGMPTTLLQWGERDNRNGKKGFYLNVVDDLTIVPVEMCRKNYEMCTNEEMPDMNDDFICTKTTVGSRAKFEEDVAGPLMYRNNFGNSPRTPWILVAVDTFRPSCGNSRLFSRVSSNMNWIERIMKE